LNVSPARFVTSVKRIGEREREEEEEDSMNG
jgi:hypothetical protein